MSPINTQAISLECIARACALPEDADELFPNQRPIWQKHHDNLTFSSKPPIQERYKWQNLSVWETLLTIEDLMMDPGNFLRLSKENRNNLKDYITRVQCQTSSFSAYTWSFFKHGLTGKCWMSTAAKAERLQSRIIHMNAIRRNRPIMEHYQGYEEQFYEPLYDKDSPNRSRIYDITDPTYKDLSSRKKGIGFINGMNTEYKHAVKNARMIADFSKVNIRAVFNCTHGIFWDLRECFNGWLGYCTKPSHKLHKLWDKYFDSMPANARYLMVCHSQGAVLVKNALKHYDPELRKRIDVVAVAPGAFINPKYCGSVVHYLASFKRDFVPLLDYIFLIIRNFYFYLIRSEKNLSEWNIRFVPSHVNAPWHDHSFRSDSFVPYIRESLEAFVNKKVI